MCLDFAAAGADVVVSSRVEEGLEELATECRALGADAVAVIVDVLETDAANRMIATAVEHFGDVDVLVNNAGIGQAAVAPDPQRRRIPDLVVEQWMHLMDVNLGGTIRCTNAVLPLMMSKQSGTIINLSSGTVRAPLAGIAAYTTTKFAIEGFTQCAAIELAEHGIRVNCIQPGGPTDTAIIPAEFPAELRADIHAPSVIRACATWVASDAATDTTGQSFVAMDWNRERGIVTCPCSRCAI